MNLGCCQNGVVGRTPCCFLAPAPSPCTFVAAALAPASARAQKQWSHLLFCFQLVEKTFSAAKKEKGVGGGDDIPLTAANFWLSLLHLVSSLSRARYQPVMAAPATLVMLLNRTEHLRVLSHSSELYLYSQF